LRRTPAAVKLGAVNMSKRETLIVALILGAVCPFLTFVAGWWTSAALYLDGVGRITERGIAFAAFAGLAVGLVADAFWLRRWVARFYRADLRFMSVLYLGCSVVAVASFMGLPLGNLALGAVAGAYVGRREFHADTGNEALERMARRAGIFTAMVTGGEALAIGILVLNERSVVQTLAAYSHLDETSVIGPAGIAFVFVLVVILMIFQFWCTRTAARRAFGWGGETGH
jgi:hypothetical protein